MALLVGLEGIDGSGKGTQAKLLHERLTNDGAEAELISFPRYSHTTFGRAIGEFLNGRFGALPDVSPYLVSLLYAGDRFESKSLITDASARMDVVIFDRYVPSNIAHQASKADANERQQLTEWIETIEYEIYELPRPDLVILLDLPATAARKLIAKKEQRDYTDKAADLQEADCDYLENVRQTYLGMANRQAGWHCIECFQQGTLRPVESIRDEIHSIVQPAVNQSG